MRVQPLLQSFTTARTLQVIRAAPVTVVRLLRSLPELYHPLVIESQVESAALTLESELLPVSCRPPPGLSTLTFLTSLSLPHTDAAACEPELFAAAVAPLIGLQYLNLHDSGITAVSTPSLCGALQQLTALKYVDLSSNVLLQRGLEALLPALQCLTNITLLSLARNSIISGRSCIQQIISFLPLLKTLDLSYNSALYPDEDQNVARSAPQLGESVEEQERSRLHEAHLRAVQFPVAPPLEKLLLINSGLDNSDFVSFVAPLLVCVAASLTCLNLSENGLTPLVAPYICDPMQHMPGLRELHLHSCAFTAADVCMMLEALQNAHTAAQPVDVEVEKEQIDCPMLEVLSVAYMDTHLMVAADAVIIGRCTTLKSLDMSCLEMPMPSMDIVQIQNLTALTALDISNSLLYDEFPDQLSILTGLLSLKASAVLVELPVAPFLEALAMLTSLTELDLQENELQDSAGLACALRGMTEIQQLHLGSNDLLLPKSELPAALALLPSLRMLMLSDNEADAEVAQALAHAIKQLTGLTALMLDDTCKDKNATLALGAVLQTLTGLSALDLSGNELPRVAQPALADMLQRMSHLQELELSGVNLNALGVELVSAAVADLPRLSVLVFSGNHIAPSIAPSAGKAFQRLEWLRELDLSSARLGHKGLTMISHSIRNCTSLQAVNLGDMSVKEDKPIQGVGWADILSALADLPGLRELMLGENVFTRALVSESIAPVMSRLSALQALNIEDCVMNADTVAAWMAAVAPLTWLNGLCIGGNTLPADIGSLLSQFHLLEDISLRDSGLSDNDLQVLSSELVSLSGLRMLALSLNDLSEEAVSRAAEVLPRVIIEFEQDDEDDVLSMDGDDETEDDDEADEETDSDDASEDS